jgi:hypothetical protein
MIRNPASLRGLLGGMPDRCAIDCFSRLGAHAPSKRRRRGLAITGTGPFFHAVLQKKGHSLCLQLAGTWFVGSRFYSGSALFGLTHQGWHKGVAILVENDRRFVYFLAARDRIGRDGTSVRKPLLPRKLKRSKRRTFQPLGHFSACGPLEDGRDEMSRNKPEYFIVDPDPEAHLVHDKRRECLRWGRHDHLAEFQRSIVVGLENQRSVALVVDGASAFDGIIAAAEFHGRKCSREASRANVNPIDSARKFRISNVKQDAPVLHREGENER